MIPVVITFGVTTLMWWGIFWLAARRVIHHLKDNQEGVAAITAHLLIPILGRQKKAAGAEVIQPEPFTPEQPAPAAAPGTDAKPRKKGLLA